MLRIRVKIEFTKIFVYIYSSIKYICVCFIKISLRINILIKIQKDICVGFMGFGEIGSSLYRVYERAYYTNLIKYDPSKNLNNSLRKCKIVNVCIPFFGLKQFCDAIKLLKLKPKTYLIIQSTIGVGTCDIIQQELDLIVIQSPVRGVHPNLSEGMITFDKYVGISEKYYNDTYIINFIKSHLIDINMKPVICKAKESELAKIVSTTLYGINIAAINDVFLMCKKHNVDFDIVFTKWQQDYNNGYTKLGKPNVCRPILTSIPVNKDGKQLIGGHCIIPNAVILKNIGENEIANYVLRYADDSNKKHITGAKH